MAKNHQRAVALILALLFLATSVVTGVMVIFQIRKDNSSQSEINTEISSSESDSANQLGQNSEENSLQGTKLEGFKPVDNVDKLEVVDIKEGSGEVVKEGATVTAHYTGALAKDGTIFQSSKDFGEAIEFGLNGVIKGWTEGVPGMKVGGVRRLVIPAEMAYGSNPPQGSGIPADAPLVFDIELSEVKNP